MSTPGYPNIDYQIGFSITPQSASTRVRIAPNGRAHVQHLGVYDDSTLQIVHPFITEDEMAELRAHWDVTKSDEFSFTDAAGRDWMARYQSKPVEKHEVVHYWSVTVTLLLRRLDQA